MGLRDIFFPCMPGPRYRIHFVAYLVVGCLSFNLLMGIAMLEYFLLGK
jgi:hypothetical protein